MAWPSTCTRKAGSERPASSGENSTSSHSDRAKDTALITWSTHSSRSMRSLCFRWMSLVARKVWMRWRGADLTASWARLMSASLARASPAITIGRPSRRPSVRGPTSSAMRRTASKSPGEAMGKPASQMSTPRRDSCRAISSFSSTLSVAPGDCSPSRRVVSKINTVSALSVISRLAHLKKTTNDWPQTIAGKNALAVVWGLSSVVSPTPLRAQSPWD